MGIMVTDELLSTSDVADRLNVSERTVQGWITSGLLSARKIGGVNIVLGQDLDRFQKPKQGRPRMSEKSLRSGADFS
ncbi:MAG TPA: helix-turn-helix domain-containing protein [Pyrinomonadaceae bacterium]|nr:helix-turn-helix domain-containing protein [Pyrinomonadaceae bacterium]